MYEFEAQSISRKDLQSQNIRGICKAGERLLNNYPLIIGSKYSEDFEIGDQAYELKIDIGHFPCPKNDVPPFFSSLIELYADNYVSVSERIFRFFEDDGGLVVIRSYSLTEPGYESRGFGQALFRVGHQSIWKLIELESIHDRPVVAEVVDNARGMQMDVKRSGWTANLALELGYEACGLNDKQLPVFRFSFR
jgi:hypothetical protein